MARVLDVPCLVEIESTPEALAAHADCGGVAFGPGDVVMLHGAPASVGFGERLSVPCRATVRRAGVLGRLRARLDGMLALTELYEVGFDAPAGGVR